MPAPLSFSGTIGRAYGCISHSWIPAAMTLEWGSWRTDPDHSRPHGQNVLTVVTDTAEHVVLAGREPDYVVMSRVRSDDPNWQTKLEDALIEALTSDESCLSEIEHDSR